jgi:hypothetical protein
LQIPPWSIMSILRDGAKGCHKMGGQSLMMWAFNLGLGRCD